MPFHHKNPINRLYLEEWKFCSCGNPEKAVETIKECLQLLSKPHTDKEAQEAVRIHFDNPFGLVIGYWLAQQDLTEHGGSIYGSWLSEKGEKVLAMLNALEWDEKEEFVECDHEPKIDEVLPDELEGE